ncbi:MAG: hypothetical protein A2X18_01185 [Bacteroidetes bacterium GWF2_40_14]|nr:MAG: hypothetical protein A2X18_01185 [Bacteroidetes bacterium GWF2_40_14]
MKGIVLLVLSWTLFSLCNAQTSLPEIRVKTTNGKEIKLSDFAKSGKPLVISFWATWCNPCLEELEAIADCYESWKKKCDFEFLAISIDDSRSSGKVKSVASGKRWPFKVLIDENQEIMKAMNVSEVPFCFIINKKGVAVYRHSGYIPGDEITLLKEIKKVSNE